jgi:hypothetical protein
MNYAGMMVFVTRSTPVTVERSWFERWFSWPWRPWVATKTVLDPPVVPHDYAVSIGNDLFCSEKIYERLKARREDARANPSMASRIGDLHHQ